MKRIITLVLTVLIAFSLFGCSGSNTSYSAAKNEGVQTLNEYKTQFERTAKSALESDDTSSGKIDSFSWYVTSDGVVFEIDSQGTLGGQYWHVVYTPDGAFRNEVQFYYNNGSDISHTEKAELIDGNWWFYWIDYDKTELSNK